MCHMVIEIGWGLCFSCIQGALLKIHGEHPRVKMARLRRLDSPSQLCFCPLGALTLICCRFKCQ